jgi:hypothetical protein
MNFVPNFMFALYTGYFTSDNEPHKNKNATHNTFLIKAGYFNFSSQLFRKCSVGYIFNFVGLIITREVACM